MNTDTNPVAPTPRAPTPRAPVRMRRVGRWLAVFVSIYAAMCGALVFMEPRLIFPGAYFERPLVLASDRFTSEKPQTIPVVDFPVKSEDGSTLVGRILVRPAARRVILFLHGNGIRAREMDGWTQRLSDTLGATVLTAEYRGFMRDGFAPTESSVIADGVASLVALANFTEAPPSEIIVFGASLGGGIAAGVVEFTMKQGAPTRTLVLDRTFDSTLHIGSDRFFFLPVSLLMRNRFESDRRLASFQGNLIQVHGPEDEVVPIQYGRALFEALSTTNKVWIEVNGLRHNDREPLELLKQIDRELTRMGS